jgi:hypothetical protein
MFVHTLIAANKNPQLQVPPVDMSGFEGYQALKRSIGLDQREIMTLVYK